MCLERVETVGLQCDTDYTLYIYYTIWNGNTNEQWETSAGNIYMINQLRGYIAIPRK